MGNFESIPKAGLLMQAAEVTDKVDDGVLFLESFNGQGVCILTFLIELCYIIAT